MARRYSAFLVRHWYLGDEARRIEVIHVQSSASALVSSLAAATAWIDALARDPPPTPSAGPEDPSTGGRPRRRTRPPPRGDPTG